MSDLISRQAAIDALHMDTSIIPFKKAREYADATISEIRNRLEKLPSAEPKRGWWIEIINSRGVVVALRCSRCEKSPRHGARSDFCPNCGAKMEVDDE